MKTIEKILISGNSDNEERAKNLNSTLKKTGKKIIEGIEDSIQTYKDQIADTERGMTLVTDTNKGLKEKTRAELIIDMTHLFSLKQSIAVLDRNLEIAKKTQSEYFPE